MDRVVTIVGTFSAGVAAGYYFYDATKEKKDDQRDKWKQDLVDKSFNENDKLKLHEKTRAQEIIEQLHRQCTENSSIPSSDIRKKSIELKHDNDSGKEHGF